MAISYSIRKYVDRTAAKSFFIRCDIRNVNNCALSSFREINAPVAYRTYVNGINSSLMIQSV